MKKWFQYSGFVFVLVVLLMQFTFASRTAMANQTGVGVEAIPSAHPSSSVPDDIYWDNRFTNRGLDGVVQAIATSGSNVYVGGFRQWRRWHRQRDCGEQE